MFTRTELELLSVPQLKILCNRYGLRPTGNGGYKTNYITSLMAFPVLAIHQLEKGEGLKSPSFASLQEIGSTLDEMGSPTTEQAALLRISFEGRRMTIPARYDQEKLIAIYKAKNHLEEVISLMEM
ncbi:hypothetical protein IQ243_11685 [Nostocales cyanobacterium LEGE 11386]|nr:hypothetical protein [Nostocales cyanobacterium LEGE 11386]